LSETLGDINALWEREKQALSQRILCLVNNIQLLHQSAEDANHDAKQWAAMSGELDPMTEAVESGAAEDGEECRSVYQSDNIGNATCLINVLRSTMGRQQITAGSKEISAMVWKLYRFQETALCSTDDLCDSHLKAGNNHYLGRGVKVRRGSSMLHNGAQETAGQAAVAQMW
jgi:hypothetical protein